jgi:hypothetical protein
MENQALFVDFMYAVTVGASLPRLDEKVLDYRDPLLWGLIFLLAVFLEDFYLYHVKVLPYLKGFPKSRGFILTMTIIGTWYLSQAAFPTKPRLFLVAFALFFLLKLLGGLFMKPLQYPLRQDAVFLMPVAAAFVAIILADQVFFVAHAGRFLCVLAPIWLLTVWLWWSRDKARMADVQSGTWSLNLAKSTLALGPVPKSASVKVKADHDEMKLAVDSIEADGRSAHVAYNAKFNGKDHPVTGLSYADTVAVERIDAATIQSTLRKSSPVIMTVRSTISEDGKTRTITFRCKDAQGHDVNNVAVYDKK